MIPLSASILLLLFTLFSIVYVAPYFFENARLRSIPGPLIARFSNLWLLLHSRRGRRFLAVDAAHEHYGTFVRIQPDHVSIADEEAIPLVYGHGNGFVKSQYYDAFVSIQRGLFNTRDRVEHSRKRKIISHTFSARSVGQFEQYIHANVRDLIEQWTRLSTEAQIPDNPAAYAELDSLHWFNYLAFDVIGDLAFGRPFGMLKAGADQAVVRSLDDSSAPPTHVPAIQVINRRGEVSNTLGAFPQLKPWAPYLPDPFFRKGAQAVNDLAGIGIAAVKTRLAESQSGIESTRTDLLTRLMQGKDDTGEPMSEPELTAEALTQLIAGSDTISNTCCAFFYHVTKTPGIWPRLQSEIDCVPTTPDQDSLSYDHIKSLPYLSHCIDETLRLHSTSSLGLPRIVTSASGVTFRGHHFPQGSVLSVPAYTLHHSKQIWGADVLEFRPERWEAENLTPRQKAAFIPFSTGPRACVGRNLAEMELKVIIAAVVRNFDLVCRQDELRTREGFLRKPLGCLLGVRRRKVIGT